MPRRRKSSPADDFTAALSKLPWWVCLIVALVSYLGLHAIAARPLPQAVVTAGRANLTEVMTGSMIHALAFVGQWVVPMFALVAAVMSVLGRRKRRELLLNVTEGGASAAAVDAMSWQDFELLIAEAFRLQGFTVAERGGGGADGGVDMELTRDGERWLVQAKHWRARQVPVEVVRELAGVMPFRRAVGGYVVTSGRFTGPAEEFASGRGIVLVNGAKLGGMLQQARASLDTRPGVAAPAGAVQRPASTGVGLASPPACPSCSGPMVKRTARTGARAGQSFWGCARYPACKGVRQIDG